MTVQYVWRTSKKDAFYLVCPVVIVTIKSVLKYGYAEDIPVVITVALFVVGQLTSENH